MVKCSTSSPVRYPGGKFRARKIIEEYLPNESSKILSPFFGGGSFELYATGLGHFVIGADGFKSLANFWTNLLSNPEEMADELQKYLGNVDSDLFKSVQIRQKSNDDPNSLIDAVEFILINRCSFSGATFSGGFSKESARTRFTQSLIDKIRSFKNDNLKFEYGLFEEVIPQYADSVDLMFLDPPYLLDGAKNSLYGIGGDMHKSFDHNLFYEVVVDSNKPFILTYNNSDEIRNIWKDYKILDAELSYGMNKSKKSSEIIIIND